MNKNKVIVLIDEPLHIDRRVQNAIRIYNDPFIEDCSGILPFSYSMYVFNASKLFKAVILCPFYWFKLNKKYKLKFNSIFAGLKRSLRINSTAIKKSLYLKNKYKNQNVSKIYANDLKCGLVGIYLAKYLNADLIYDAHEIEFHRNRKNSLLRVVFDIISEQKVINKSSKVFLVNRLISDVYQDIYQIAQDKVSIVNNMFYAPYYGYTLNLFNNDIKNAAITYIGAGINGRKLDNLTNEAIALEINLFGFFLSDPPRIASERPWVLGPKEYLPELLELIKTNRLAMWACVNNISLSYRLSLGNKFFQSMALGIPVIASKGTYLAEIVTEYELGYIYDNCNLIDIVSNIQNNNKYYYILQSIKKFQVKLFEEKMIL